MSIFAFASIFFLLVFIKAFIETMNGNFVIYNIFFVIFLYGIELIKRDPSGSKRNLPTLRAGSQIVIPGLISPFAISMIAHTTLIGVKNCPQFFLLMLSLRKLSKSLLLKS
jgi:hypothetical protein